MDLPYFESFMIYSRDLFDIIHIMSLKQLFPMFVINNIKPKFLPAPGEAFEVSLEEESDSIIKKHPPKRLQRLVDAPETQTTIEELEEKLANAEIRRNQV